MAALALLTLLLAVSASAAPLRTASKQITVRRTAGLAFRGGDAHVGGACGFQKTFPLNGTTFVAGASSRFFGKGNVCGMCYELSCLYGKQCNKGSKVVVTVTNQCSGGRGNNGSPCRHGAFDVQPKAFDKIAKNANGLISVGYKPVPCSYKGGVQLMVLNGDTYFLQVLIQNVAGPGALKGVAVRASGSTVWKAMTNNYGSVWDLSNYSIKNQYLSFLLVGYNNQKLVLQNVIPPTFKIQHVYNAAKNFQ